MKKHAVDRSTYKEKEEVRVPLNKTLFMMKMVGRTDFSKQEVAHFLAEMRALIVGELVGRGAPGEVQIPDLGIKVRIAQRQALPERTGVDPRTGKKIKLAARPASKTVKARVMKRLKDEILD